MKTPRFASMAAMASAAVVVFVASPDVKAQLIDRTTFPNVANEGIAKSLTEQIGAGRGDLLTPGSSAFIIGRDPFRSIRRGRQIFQRKFGLSQGVGPRANDIIGEPGTNITLGAGIADSCAACHGRPRGSAGFGGDVVTRPDSRDAPHLFGLGLKEMLADEITSDLRGIRTAAIAEAQKRHRDITRRLSSKGIDYGKITARADGSVETNRVSGVDADLRVRPFFAHGATISMREFIVGALQDEMGLQAVEPGLATAHAGGRFVTPSGMVLDGSLDEINPVATVDPAADPDGDGVKNEIPESLVDHLEFYLLNYFKPGAYEQTHRISVGRRVFERIGCARCHVPDIPIVHDRRVADVETVFDPEKGIFNGMFATAVPLTDLVADSSGYPPVRRPQGGHFLVKDIFTDFRRHDLGPNFHERNYDGTMRTEFLTTALWGVGSTAPYGHDGRSINLTEVILRHGGEAIAEAAAFERLPDGLRGIVLDFLNSLIIFPPVDTASNLNPGDRNDPNFPQAGHGSIKLPVLFNDPTDPE